MRSASRPVYLKNSDAIFDENYNLALTQQRKNKDLPDLNRREQWTLIPLIVIAFWVGLYPKPFFERMAPTVDRVLQRVEVARHDQGPSAGDHVAELAHAPAGEAAGEHGE